MHFGLIVLKKRNCNPKKKGRIIETISHNRGRAMYSPINELWVVSKTKIFYSIFFMRRVEDRLRNIVSTINVVEFCKGKLF